MAKRKSQTRRKNKKGGVKVKPVCTSSPAGAHRSDQLKQILDGLLIKIGDTSDKLQLMQEKILKEIVGVDAKEIADAKEIVGADAKNISVEMYNEVMEDLKKNMDRETQNVEKIINDLNDLNDSLEVNSQMFVDNLKRANDTAKVVALLAAVEGKLVEGAMVKVGGAVAMLVDKVRLYLYMVMKDVEMVLRNISATLGPPRIDAPQRPGFFGRLLRRITDKTQRRGGKKSNKRSKRRH